MTGTPFDLDDSDLDLAALNRTDEEAALVTGPEPVSPIEFPVGVSADTFEPVDHPDFIHPDDPYTEYGDGYNHEEIVIEIPEEDDEVDI